MQNFAFPHASFKKEIRFENGTYKGGIDGTSLLKVFLEYFQDDFSSAPAIFSSCLHIS